MKKPASTTTEVRPGGWRCTYFSSPARALLEGTPAWLAPASGGAVLLKENELRRVYRLEAPGGGLIIKQHLLKGLAALKATLLGNPAGREARAAQYAHGHGVPVADTLAVAVRRAGAGCIEAIGVSREIPDAHPLDEVYESLGAGPGRRAKLKALGEAVAELLVRAHRARFLHPDGHPGNILVQECGDGFECFYIDVYGAACGREVELPAAARNLAAIQQWFALRTTRAQRLRVLKAYAAGRGWSGREPFRRLATLVARASIAHAFALYAERDRRMIRSNRWYSVELTEGLLVTRPRRLRPKMAAFIAGEAHVVLVLEDGRVATGVRMAAERFFPPGRLTALWWALAGSPAARRFTTAARAMHRDLPSVAPAEYRVSRRRGGPDEQWTAMLPPGGMPFMDWVTHIGGHRRAAGLESAGRLVADTLARGLVLRNAGVDRLGIVDVAGEPLEAYWDKAEAVGCRRPATAGQGRWVLGELAASAKDLSLSRVDAARFLRAFARRRGDDWRAWWRMIVRDGAEEG